MEYLQNTKPAKNYMNEPDQEKEFSLKIERHFLAVSCGKGNCDGKEGATVGERQPLVS
jgi:hypothetical protein